MNVDEDLTMIDLPQTSGPDKEIEQRRDQVNGKEVMSLYKTPCSYQFSR